MVVRKTSKKKVAKKTGASASKKKATSAATKVPAGARSAGNRKSSKKSAARAVSKTAKKATKKAAKKVVKKAVAKKVAKKAVAKKAIKKAVSKKAVSKKAVKKKPAAKKKATRKPKRAQAAQELAQSSVAPEMAQAMMGEMGMAEEAAIEKANARNLREEDLLCRLAVQMNRHDDMPNLELAANIVFAFDRDAVEILAGVIVRFDDVHSPDCARVLREVGEREPELLDTILDEMLAVCDQGETEMLPFAMYALSPVADRVAGHLWDMREILWTVLSETSEHSDLAHEAAVRLLSALCASGPDYARTLAGGLVDLLGKCNPKDVALYAESVLPALGSAHSHRAKPVLDRRMKELTPAEVARLRRAVRAAQTGQSYSYAA